MSLQTHRGRWDIRTSSAEPGETARQKSGELRFRAIFEGAAIGIALVDMEGRPVASNPALERALGYSADELCEMVFTEFTHPEDAGADWDLFQELVAGERDRYQLAKRYVRKDGELVWGKLTVSLVRSAAGEPEYAIGMVEDVTELRKAEEALRASEEQLRQTMKFEAIGRLAGGVAHDFNNILTVILGASDFLLERLEGGDLKRVEEIGEAAERAASLTRQLLAFGRRQPLQPILLDLNEVVSGTATLLRRMLGADVELATLLDPALAPVVADPSQLEQVLMNFAVNARDAMPHGGRLTMETRNALLEEPYPTPWIVVPSGRYIRLAVTDTGLGMDEETRFHCFDPFFTTKEAGKGTGLGLSTAYGIVKQSGGYIWVDSEPGQGASFKVYLPQVEAGRDVQLGLRPLGGHDLSDHVRVPR